MFISAKKKLRLVTIKGHSKTCSLIFDNIIYQALYCGYFIGLQARYFFSQEGKAVTHPTLPPIGLSGYSLT